MGGGVYFARWIWNERLKYARLFTPTQSSWQSLHTRTVCDKVALESSLLPCEIIMFPCPWVLFQLLPMLRQVHPTVLWQWPSGSGNELQKMSATSSSLLRALPCLFWKHAARLPTRSCTPMTASRVGCQTLRISKGPEATAGSPSHDPIPKRQDIRSCPIPKRQDIPSCLTRWLHEQLIPWKPSEVMTL